MNEPDEETGASENTDFRDGVRGVASALRDLHKALIDVAKSDYERRSGPVGGPSQLLHLVMFDPAFGWMHMLSELMVDIDELLDVETLGARDAAAVRFEVEQLISPPEGEISTFTRHYVEALQSDPDLVIAHGKVRRVLASLPQMDDEVERPHREVRSEWSQRRSDARRRQHEASRERKIH